MTDIDDILYSPIAKPETVRELPIPANILELFVRLEQYLTSFQKGFKYPNDDRVRSFYKDITEQYIRSADRNDVYSFSVTCDTTNNPPIVIDTGKIILDALVQPYGSCGSYLHRVIF